MTSKCHTTNCDTRACAPPLQLGSSGNSAASAREAWNDVVGATMNFSPLHGAGVPHAVAGRGARFKFHVAPCSCNLKRLLFFHTKPLETRLASYS